MKDAENKINEFIEDAAKAAFDEPTNALSCLFKFNKQEIVSIYEGTEDLTDFHKAFRQRDITDNGHVDMAIWYLIGSSKFFWDFMHEK